MYRLLAANIFLPNLVLMIKIDGFNSSLQQPCTLRHPPTYFLHRAQWSEIRVIDRNDKCLVPPHEKWNLCIVIVRAALSRDTAGGWSCDTSTAATPYIRPQLGEIWAEFVVSPGPVLDCPSLYPRTPSSHQIIFSICSAGCRYAMYQYRKISENKWGSKPNNPQ